MGLNRWRRILEGLALIGSLHPGLAGVSLAGEETAQQTTSPPSATLAVTLRAALAAAVENNPDVLLYKERIEAARGQVQTQLGAMLPNLSSNVRQTRQTQFLGTFGLSPNRTDPFSIFGFARQRVAKSPECQLDSTLARLTRNAPGQRVGVRKSKVRHDGRRGAHLYGRPEGHGHGEDA